MLGSMDFALSHLRESIRYGPLVLGSLMAALAFATLLLPRRAHRLGLLFLVLAILILAARVGITIWRGDTSWDFLLFYGAGANVWQGVNPYSPPDSLQNPPSALPLFALLALLPRELASHGWMTLNAVALVGFALAAPWLCRAVEEQGAGRRAHDPSAAQVRILSAAAVASVASLWGMAAGQMAIWTAVCLFLMMYAWARKRHLLAGLFLALATVKLATAAPFVLLFVNKERWTGVLSFALCILVLCVLATPPLELPGRLSQNLKNLEANRTEGAKDDYLFAVPISDDLISLDRWLYCLGLRDRTLIRFLQLGLLGILAGWLWWEAGTRKPRLGPGDLCSLFCVASCLFFYHRLYDAIILAYPIAHGVRRAWEETGWRRALRVTTVAGLLLVLNMPRGEVLQGVASWSQEAGALGRLVQATLLPYAVWVLLFALGAIGLAGHRPDSLDFSNGVRGAN